MLFSDLREKDVVDGESGRRLGYVDDVVFDENSACIKGLVVYGRGRLLGLLGREKDVELLWSDIEVIGSDAIIIKKKNR